MYFSTNFLENGSIKITYCETPYTLINNSLVILVRRLSLNSTVKFLNYRTPFEDSTLYYLINNLILLLLIYLNPFYTSY